MKMRGVTGICFEINLIFDGNDTSGICAMRIANCWQTLKDAL